NCHNQAERANLAATLATAPADWKPRRDRPDVGGRGIHVCDGKTVRLAPLPKVPRLVTGEP
ncbi:MAG TPA: hypothetical protein VGC36_09030, partial [Rhizomicrobium sp.]